MVNDLLLTVLPLLTVGILVVWFARSLGREEKGRFQIRMRTLMAVMTAAAILAAGGVYDQRLILLAIFSFFVVVMLWAFARLFGKSERGDFEVECSPFDPDMIDDDRTEDAE